MILEVAQQNIISLGPESIVNIWRKHKVCGKVASLIRTQILDEAAYNSVRKYVGTAQQ